MHTIYQKASNERNKKMKIGIDIGGSHIGVALVNEDGEIVKKIEQDIIKKNCKY